METKRREGRFTDGTMPGVYMGEDPSDLFILLFRAARSPSPRRSADIANATTPNRGLQKTSVETEACQGRKIHCL